MFNYKSNADRALKLSDKYYDIASQYLSAFVDNIISLSIFSLGFIGFFLKELDIRNVGVEKFIFILGVICFIFSIILGVCFKFGVHKFLNRIGDAYYKRHKKINFFIHEKNISEGTFPVDDAIKDLPNIPDGYMPWWHKLQICLFLVGVLSYIFLLLDYISL